MSTLTKPPTHELQPARVEDPFPLGWRFIPRITPDGTETSERVPLTPEDVLHPQEGDYIVTRDPHDNDRIYLKTVARSILKDDPNALVLSDYRIDLAIPGVEPFGSDLAIILGLRERKRPGGTYYVADEGVRPSLLAEITSPETRGNDVGVKIGFYHQAGVPWYIVIDHKDLEKKGTIRLFGYRYEHDKYAEMVPSEKGWLWIEPLKHWLGVEGGEVRFFDLNGTPIGDYVTVSRALADAEARQKEAEAKQLEAETKQMEAEAMKKDAEARADAETKKRQELEQRLRDIEDKLRHATPNGRS